MTGIYCRLPQQPESNLQRRLQTQTTSSSSSSSSTSQTMKLLNRNKSRLLLGLYARPKHPDSPHYALLVTPKILPSAQEILPASKYHVKNTLEVINHQPSQPWRFEQVSLQDIAEDPRLLVAVVVGKVASLRLLEEALQQTPVYQIDDPDREKALAFDCRIWVRDALDGLRASDIVSVMPDWEIIDGRALGYMREKKEAGRWTAGKGKCDNVKIPILDLLTDREVVL